MNCNLFTVNTGGAATAASGPSPLQGNITQTAVNYTTVATDYIVVATALDLEITIGTVSQNAGQWIVIKDGTGKASRANPLRIVAQGGGFGFDNNPFDQLFITSPNGALAMFVDPTTNQIYTAPWNPVLDGTIATTTYSDYDGTASTAELALRTLPLGPTSANEISIKMTAATMVPYISADTGGSSATMNFSHRFFDGTNQILTLPDTDTLTVTNGTNTYFSGDGTLDATQNYATFGAFGQIRINVAGNAVGSTPSTLAIVNIDSRGLLPGPEPVFSCTVVDRTNPFLELD